MEPPLPELFARRFASNQHMFLFADEPWTLELTNSFAVLLNRIHVRLLKRNN